MAALTQDMVALVARHHGGIARLLGRARIEPSKIVVLIAHVESPVGRSFVQAGLVPAPGRSSICVPTGIEAAKMFTDLLEQPEVKLLAERHHATAILVFDSRGKVGITFENFRRMEPRDYPS